jgi:hypothetical protein
VNACKGIFTGNVHGAAAFALINILREQWESIKDSDCGTGRNKPAANTLTTRTTESESGVDLVLDLDECIEDHWTTLLQVHLVGLCVGFTLLFTVPIDLEVDDCEWDGKN